MDRETKERIKGNDFCDKNLGSFVDPVTEFGCPGDVFQFMHFEDKPFSKPACLALSAISIAFHDPRLGVQRDPFD